MPANTAERLAAYYAAELRILDAQRLGHGDRTRQNAELAEVRRGITALEAQLATDSRTGPVTLVADFSRGLG